MVSGRSLVGVCIRSTKQLLSCSTPAMNIYHWYVQCWSIQKYPAYATFAPLCLLWKRIPSLVTKARRLVACRRTSPARQTKLRAGGFVLLLYYVSVDGNAVCLRCVFSAEKLSEDRVREINVESQQRTLVEPLFVLSINQKVLVVSCRLR